MLSQEGDKPVRTITQNKAIHKYFDMLSESLNNAGLDVLTVLDSNIEIEWTNELVVLFSSELALMLNNSGLTFHCALGKGKKVKWSPAAIKDLVWRKVQRMQFDIESTAKLDTSHVSCIYELINRHIASKFGVSVVFPSKDR